MITDGVSGLAQVAITVVSVPDPHMHVRVWYQDYYHGCSYPTDRGYDIVGS